MRLSALRALFDRRWLKVTAGTVVIVLLVMTTVWTVRYGWAIYRLNEGVGDTIFLDAAGREWFRLDEQRRDVPLDQISTYLKDAVIAVEDHRYYNHPGIDPIGLGRAMFSNIRTDRTQGGSTITQQLARTLFLSNSKTLGRKAKEAALAVMLEVFLSKREILQLYLNRVFLSGGVYGVETMSQKMLRKPASKLTLAEAALIAGIIRAPATYSPWRNFDSARERSFVVLRRMREEKKITRRRRSRRTPSGSAFSRRRRYRAHVMATPRSTCASSSATSTAATTRPTGKCGPRSCRKSRTPPKRPSKRDSGDRAFAACRLRSSPSIRRPGTFWRWLAARTSRSRRSIVP
jgi:membrane peptidoglycan carboxypeptidase